MNNPKRIQFTNGNVTKYIYSATGEKLRTIYQTAVPNITVAMGSKHELTDAEVLYKDSVDYYHGGRLTVKNGRLDKCYFDGGYAQASPVGVALNCKPSFFRFEEEGEIIIEDDDGNVIEVETVQPSQSSSQQSSNFPLHDPISKSDEDVFAFYYYTVDHLGNIREVINENGAVEQITNYYPFGTPFAAEAGNTNPDLQNHKYNGKEFDTMHGLNTYDYGARQYSSLVGRWDRMDQLAERDYATSPYVYCHNNPINRFDADGNIDYFSNKGVYLYSRGTEPSMYVQRGNSFVNLSSLDLRNNANMQTAANIVGHYAREVGISYNQNGGTGTVGISTLHGTDNSKNDVLAATVHGNIFLKMMNGKLSEFMYNIYQMRGTLRHEGQHKEDMQKNIEATNTRHAEIILNEMKHSDFSNSSKEYQEGQVGQFKSYIRAAIKKEENNEQRQILVQEAMKRCKELGIDY